MWYFMLLCAAFGFFISSIYLTYTTDIRKK